MTKDDFIEKINAIGLSLTLATSYFSAYESMSHAAENRLDELNYAPGFFGLAAKALLGGFFMETAKLFESPKRGYSIEKFLNVCEQHLPKVDVDMTSIYHGYEKDFCETYIKGQIIEWKRNFCNLSEDINKLMGIRDNYYGHIDKNYMNDLSEAFRKFPFSTFYDLKPLLEFAVQVLNGVRSYLTGVHYDHKLSDSADLKNLLGALHASKYDVWGNKIDEDALRKLRRPSKPTIKGVACKGEKL